MLGRALIVACALTAALPSAVRAQEGGTASGEVDAAAGSDTSDETSDEASDQTSDDAVPNTAAAAEAYDRGSAFYLNGDYARAAQWFETAYRLAPAAPALIQALRAQMQTGHAIRSANLALRLRGLHADDDDARVLADQVIAENGADFVLLELSCDDCQLEIEGRVWSYRAAYLTPNTDHDVIVRQGEHRERHRIRGRAGQSIELGPPRADAPDPDRVEPPPPSTRPGSGGLSPWFFGVGAGLTALSTVLLIWSGVDTLDGVDAFNAMPTPEAFEEGQAKELRTNVLIGITAGLAVVTLLFGVLADWDGEPAPSTTAGVFFDGRAGGAWLRTSF